MPMIINGEEVSDREIEQLVALVENDAKKVAGEFHNMKRSRKFRAMWPNEYDFAERNWKNFVVAVRAMYAQRLASPNTPSAEAATMHKALVIQAMAGASPEASDTIQATPNTETFEGDRAENIRTDESFGIGTGPGSLKDRMLRTAGRRLYH